MTIKIDEIFEKRFYNQRIQICDYRELWIIEKLLEPIDTPKEILKFLQEFGLRQLTLRKFSLRGPRNKCLKNKLEMKYQFLSSYAEIMFWLTQKMEESDDEFVKKSGEMLENMASKVQIILNVNEFGAILLQDDMFEHITIEKKKKEVLDKDKEFG